MTNLLTSSITLNHIAWLPAVAFLAFASAAPAATKDPCGGQVFSPDGDLCVTITAHRSPQERKYVGSSTTIITRDEIERRGIRNVADALKRVPGVAMARTGGFGSTTNIRLRGSDSGQVRVLIDGVTVNDPTNTENFFDFNSLQTNNIERIEVVRGPQSSLYGADTTGGIINIITRQKVASAKTDAFAEVGSYNSYRVGASHHDTSGKIYYGASVQHFTTQGFSRNAATPDEDDGARSTDIKANIGVELTENLTFEVLGGYSDDVLEFDQSTADTADEQDKRQIYGSANLNYQSLGGKLEQSLKLNYFNVDRDFDQPTGFFRYSTFEGRRQQATYQADLALRQRDTATLGLDWQRDGASTTTTSGSITSAGINDDTNNRAVFGQYILGLTDEWTVTAGGRIDDHSNFGAHPTYRFTTAYNIPSTGTTLRGTYGTGFKAPSLFQLFATTFGNPNLEPEESRAFDIGIEQQLVDNRLHFQVTAFQSEVKNLITFTTGYENVARANVKGIESSASFAITPHILLSGNHTYLISEDEATERSLPRRPKHVAGAALDIDLSDEARVSTEVLYTSSQWDRGSGDLRVKPHTLVNLNGSVNLDERHTLYADLENIFNKDYEEIVGFQAPGFTVFLGIRASY